jgi:hypothetical protein
VPGGAGAGCGGGCDVRGGRGGREPRLLHTRSFEDYRRFVSDVKIIEDDEPEN